MRVQKIHANSGYEFALLDDEGLAISVVTDFLGYLRARGCSLNTLVAYAHDLQHSVSSSSAQRFIIRSSHHDELWTSCNTYALYPVAAKSESSYRKSARVYQRGQRSNLRRLRSIVFSLPSGELHSSRVRVSFLFSVKSCLLAATSTDHPWLSKPSNSNNKPS